MRRPFRRLLRLVKVWDYLMTARSKHPQRGSRLGLESLELREVPSAVLVQDVQHLTALIPYGSSSDLLVLDHPVRTDATLVTGTSSQAADWAANAAVRYELVDTDGDATTAEAVQVSRGGDGGNAESGTLAADVSVVEFESGVRIEHLLTDVVAGATQVDLPLAASAPAGQSFVVLSASTGANSPIVDGLWSVRGELVDGGDTLRLRRSQTDATATVAAQVITFDSDSGATVQTGTVALVNGSATALYTPVAGADPFLVFSNSAPADGVEGKYRVSGSLANGQVTFTTAAGGSPWATYYVVSIPGAVVKSGVAGFAAQEAETGAQDGVHSQTLDITPVDPGRSLAVVSVSGGTGSRTDTLGDTSFIARLVSPTSLFLDRADRTDTPQITGGSSLESAATAAWFVVQLPANLAPAVVTIAPAWDTVEGHQVGMFDLARTGGDLSQPLTVTVTVGGSAIEGQDYAPVSRQVTFEAGEYIATLAIDAVEDGISEPDGETVQVSLVAGDNYTVGDANTADLTIADDVKPTDPATFVFTVNDDTADGSFALPAGTVIDTEAPSQDISLSSFQFTLAGSSFTTSDTTNGVIAHFSYGVLQGVTFEVLVSGPDVPYWRIAVDGYDADVTSGSTGEVAGVFVSYAQNPPAAPAPRPVQTLVNGKTVDRDSVVRIMTANVNSLPTTAYLTQLGVQNLITEQQFAQKVRQIMDEIAACKDQINRNYASEKQFFNDGLFRAWQTVFAQQLAQVGVGFPTDALANFDPTVTKKWVESKVDYKRGGQVFTQYGLTLRAGATPSDGIKEFFTPAGKSAKLDCASFVMVVTRRSLLEVYGEAEFNRQFKGKPIGGFGVDNGPGDMIRLTKRNEWWLAGDLVSYSYGDIKLPARFRGYQNENAINLGDNVATVVGHPFGAMRGKDLIAAVEQKTGVAGMKPLPIVNILDYHVLPK